MNEKPVKVQSVMRAMQLFEYLLRSGNPLSAIELSHKTGLNRSTVHSLLDTLISCDYVQKESAYGKYCPTAKMYALSKVYADNLPIVRICVPIVRKLALKYNLSLNLGILSPENSLFIVKEFLPPEHQYRNSGYKLPVHASTIGKIHLAFLQEATAEKLLADCEMELYTQYTIRDKDVLRKEIELVRKRGYATIRDEFIYGFSAVGFPVFDADRGLLGAFSFNSTTEIMSALPTSFLNEVIQVSRDCSMEMGCFNPLVFFADEL